MGIYSDNIFVDWRLIKLAAAVSANVAVVPRNYVVRITAFFPAPNLVFPLKRRIYYILFKSGCYSFIKSFHKTSPYQLISV